MTTTATATEARTASTEAAQRASTLRPAVSVVLAGDAPLAGVLPLIDTAWQNVSQRTLRSRLRHDGYLCLRGVLPHQQVTRARAAVLAALRTEVPGALSSEAAGEDATAGHVPAGLLGRPNIAHLPAVLAVLQHQTLFDLAAAVLGCRLTEVVTCHYKWLRAVPPGQFTGVHCDAKYVSGDIVTLWIPLGHVSLRDGGMLIAHESNRLPSFVELRQRYLSTPLGVDGTASGWLCTAAGQLASHVGHTAPVWHGGDLAPGDILVLTPTTWHMTAANVSDQLRLSCDTRWQAAGSPRDKRLPVWTDVRGDLAIA